MIVILTQAHKRPTKRSQMSLSLFWSQIFQNNLFRFKNLRKYISFHFVPNLSHSLLQPKLSQSGHFLKIVLSPRSSSHTKYAVRRSMRMPRTRQLSTPSDILTKARCTKSSTCPQRSLSMNYSTLSNRVTRPKSQTSQYPSQQGKTLMRLPRRSRTSVLSKSSFRNSLQEAS